MNIDAAGELIRQSINPSGNHGSVIMNEWTNLRECVEGRPNYEYSGCVASLP
jgi:hypothetical protein